MTISMYQYSGKIISNFDMSSGIWKYSLQLDNHQEKFSLKDLEMYILFLEYVEYVLRELNTP